jgi:AcrR family transcriptional regulator
VAETWRATEKAQRREKYLSAAGHLFAERGYHAVSIEELGAAVGVSGPALYNHFASKEAMLIELLQGASERLMVGFEKTVADGTSDQETLENLVAFHLDFALSEPDIIRIQDRELANLPTEANHRVRQLQRQYMDGWQRFLRPTCKCGCMLSSACSTPLHTMFASSREPTCVPCLPSLRS